MTTTPIKLHIDRKSETVRDRYALSQRTMEEILAMKFSPEDLYLDNGLIAKGKPSTVIGPPGIGKSRFLLQLAACAITGREFIGWPVRRRTGKWLIMQTENSNRRLHADLSALQKWLGKEDYARVRTSLVFHTVEKEHDSFLNLDNHDSANLTAACINEVGADVVAFDPLNAFSIGNTNTDTAMRATCNAMQSLARRGNPDAAVIILHHAHAGAEGARKALGFNRGLYGRNSKALHAWTRGQINIAPASEEDASRLVIGCGKNSDGPDFPPFGIALNPATMIYEVDESFSLAEWKAELAGGSAVPSHKPTPENIAVIVENVPLTRKDFVREIMEEYGCSQPTAYRAIAGAEGKTIKRDARKEYSAV